MGGLITCQKNVNARLLGIRSLRILRALRLQEREVDCGIREQTALCCACLGFRPAGLGQAEVACHEMPARWLTNLSDLREIRSAIKL